MPPTTRAPLAPSRRQLCLALALSWGGAQLPQAIAASGPYDEAQDADVAQALAQALREAAAAHQRVLLVFGANWCPDCLALDKALQQGATGELVRERLRVLKVNVGNFDRNLAINQRFGDPIRQGIPAALVLDADGQVRFATRAGELANARRMGSEGIGRFLLKVLADLG